MSRPSAIQTPPAREVIRGLRVEVINLRAEIERLRAENADYGIALENLTTDREAKIDEVERLRAELSTTSTVSK